jgi:hypothetical protein
MSGEAGGKQLEGYQGLFQRIAGGALVNVSD